MSIFIRRVASLPPYRPVLILSNSINDSSMGLSGGREGVGGGVGDGVREGERGCGRKGGKEGWEREVRE
jgi:hypothetical protein